MINILYHRVGGTQNLAATCTSTQDQARRWERQYASSQSVRAPTAHGHPQSPCTCTTCAPAAYVHSQYSKAAIHVYTRVHAHTYCTHTAHTHIQTHTHIHTHTRTRTHAHTHTLTIRVTDTGIGPEVESNVISAFALKRVRGSSGVHSCIFRHWI